MSYAVKTNGTGWRAVNGPGDCEPGEIWTSAPPSVTALMPDVVAEPPALTSQQIAKLADFLATNPDIAEAFGISAP